MLGLGSNVSIVSIFTAVIFGYLAVSKRQILSAFYHNAILKAFEILQGGHPTSYNWAYNSYNSGYKNS